MYMILGGGMMIGGPMGGMDMGMHGGMEKPGFLSILPPWLSTIVLILGVVLVGWIVGKIIGKIVGNLIYPDPEKENVFNVKKRLVIAAVIIGTVAISGVAIYISQKPAKDNSVMETENIMNGMAGVPPTDGFLEENDDTNADNEETSADSEEIVIENESFESEGSSDENESSSEESGTESADGSSSEE